MPKCLSCGIFLWCGNGLFEPDSDAQFAASTLWVRNEVAPAGRSTCQDVDIGYYTKGETEQTRSSQEPCPPGYYCQQGRLYDCPEGTYNDLSGQSSDTACKKCSAGYFCPRRSTSPIQEPCYIGPPTNPIAKPKIYYCPAGTTKRLEVSNDNYTIPVNSQATNTRSGQLPCTSAQVCVDGEAFDKITWSSTSCSALSVNENLATAHTGRTLLGQLNTAIINLGYSVTYAMSQFKLAADLIPSLGGGPCDPTANAAPYSNAGIFAVNSSGHVIVTRTTFPYYLNYEPTNALGKKCPVAGVRYELTVSATATGQNTVTTITCQIPVTVLDQNDAPAWPKEMNLQTYYRTIPEKSVINTPVLRCDAASKRDYGCPVIHTADSSVEIQASDEDYFSVLRYSFVYGPGAPYTDDSTNPFRINSCSGLISMKTDRTISFLTTKMVNFTVRVEDDGNGGQFEKRSADVPVVIFITDAADPPVLDEPSLYDFTVLENRDADQLIGRVYATDPDVGAVIAYRLKLPVDGDAFYMDNQYNIRTTSLGASTIDFESTKTTYVLNIEAYDCTPVCPGLSDIKQYQVRVLNTNDPPRFVDITPFYILENSPDGSAVCFDSSGVCTSPGTRDRVQTVDVDSGINDNTSYSIPDPNSHFTIDSFGQIRTKTGAQAFLNFEDESLSVNSGTGRNFEVTVEALSSGNGSPATSTHKFIIYLVDENERPTITNTPIFFALETAPVGSACDPVNLTAPTSIQAVDPDNADLFLRSQLAPVQTVTFSRVTNEFHPTLNDSGTLFSVFNLPTGGAIIDVVGSLNYETAPQGGTQCGAGSNAQTRCYIILVRATDNGPPAPQTRDTWVTIRIVDVNDGPAFSPPLTRTVPVSEGIGPGSQQVSATTYKANDADDTTLVYSIVSGTGIDYFDIVPGCGNSCFSIYKKANVLFDFESAQTSFNLEVQVTDNKGSKFIGQACGLVNGVPAGCDAGTVCQLKEGPFRNEYRCYERCRPTADVTFGFPRRDTYFCDYTQIQPPKSQVPIGDPFLQTADQALRFNIEIKDWNDPPYIVGDDGLATGVGCLINSSVSFLKQNTRQVAIARLRAVDVDVSYAAAPFVFSKTTPGAAFWNTFDLDNVTGQISINPTLEGNVNVDKNLTVGEYYSALVTVSDALPSPIDFVAPQASSNCTIVVVVIESNTRPNYTDPEPFEIFEGATLGTQIYGGPDLATVDPDVNANPADRLTFSMSASPYFILNPQSGAITLFGALVDYEELGTSVPPFQHNLVVRVQDLRAAGDVAIITVKVKDVNERPTWTQSSFTRGFPENSLEGALVLDLTTVSSDPDRYADGITTFKNTKYTIESGCLGSTCPFVIQAPSTTGLLVVKPGQVLDFESATKSWTMVIRATDGGDNALFSETTLTVALTDVNERPTIISGLQFSVPEGAAGQFLADLAPLVRDPDADDILSLLQINITGGDPLNTFFIDQAKLFVSPSGVLDYEGNRTYTLNITVTDRQSLSSTGSFRVDVTNVNDVTVTRVDVLTGDGLLNCNANSKIRITGTNFGMVSKLPAANVTVLYYRPTGPLDALPPKIPAQNCLVTSARNTEIECDIPGGAGMNFVFDVSITVASLGIIGDSYGGFPSSVRYSLPSISSISDVDALPTAGGGPITITGSCFGSAADQVTFINSLAAAFSSVEFCDISTCTALSLCTVTTRTSITCSAGSIPPGLGAGLRWRTKILGQLQAAYYTQGAYLPPSLLTFNTPIMATTGRPPESSKFVLTGSNFGPLNSIPDAAYFIYLTETYNFRSCIVTVAYTTVECDSADEGVGKNMVAFIRFGGQLSAQSPFTFSFAAPVIETIGGPGSVNASTIGGQFVTITGSSFGKACGRPGASVEAGGLNCALMTATYTRNSISVSTGLRIVYTASPCAIVSQTQLICATAPGTGAGHVWTVFIGGQNATLLSTASTTSYAVPVVATYEGSGASAAETNGGQFINILGSNFGPVGGALVTGKYGNKDINVEEFRSPSCNVTTAHTVITCETSAGAGKELNWIVTVDDRLGKNELTNYARPRLISTSFPANGFLDNDGNSTMILVGSDFGPPIAPGPYLESVTYGPFNFPYAFRADCAVLSHGTMTCMMGAGAGSNLAIVVKVKGQTSDPSPFRINYQPPDVSGGLRPFNAVLSTEGGTKLFVKGKGFSLCDKTATVRILWREDQSVPGFINRDLDVIEKRNSDGTVIDPPCPIGLEAQIGFILPEMNAARRARIFVQVTSTASGLPSESADWIDFQYANPALTSIFAEASAINFGGVRVSIFGENFCKSESCCRTHLDNVPLPLESIVSHSHQKVVLELTRPGSLFLRCGNVSSNALSFTTNSPFIFGTVPQLDTHEFLTVGNETFEIWGLYFGESTPNVTLNGFPIEVVTHGSVDCYSPARPSTAETFAFDSGAQCYKTKVRTPAKTGRNLKVEVIRGITKSLADDTRFEFLNYYRGVVRRIEGSAIGNELSSAGNSPIEIIGSNFGVDPGNIWIGDLNKDPILCNVTFWSDSRVLCTIGVGEGRDLPIILVQDSGTAVTAPEEFMINYLPPQDLDFDNTITHPTQGGTILTISGSNFGRPNKASIVVGGLPCTLIQSNLTQAQCFFPEGEGTGLLVVLTAGGQSVPANKRAAYSAPVIDFVTPSGNLPTAGGVTFRIFGRNFGVNQLKIFFDAYLVEERFIDPDPRLLRDNFIYPGTNHTHLTLKLPEFFGKLRAVSLSVKNQMSINSYNISFAPPQIGDITVYNEDGTRSQPFSTSVDFVFPAAAFNLTGAGLPAVSLANRRRRRMLVEQGYGLWSSGTYGPCESSIRSRDMFWKSYMEIAPNGDFRRTFLHYRDGSCSVAANQTFTVVVEGTNVDLGTMSASPLGACGLSRVYSQLTNDVRVTLLSSDQLDVFLRGCICVTTWTVGSPVSVPQTCLSDDISCPLLSGLYGTEFPPNILKYGIYVISKDVDLFMSKTTPSLAALESLKSIKFPDTPSASVSKSIANLVSSIPKGPTDGCYSWEPIQEYLERAQVEAKLKGVSVASIPRICDRRALLEIEGSNFGKPLTAEQLEFSSPNDPPSLRVFLVPDDPSIEPFEASTVVSPGSHKVVCPQPDCFQTHNRIRFWVPYGLGKSLRIRVHVGDQARDATTRFSYLPPRIEEINPGTVRFGRKFQNANGGPVLVRGFNFGGRATESSVLISGRPCTNPTWESGASSDTNGRPFLTCDAPLDVVGPKSVLLCVAGQLTYERLFRSDGPVLMAGEAVGAWIESKPFTASFASQLRSTTLSRCPTKTTGRLYELCVDCPPGAKCEDGSFTGPKSDKFFYDYEVPTYNPDGTPTERARQLCSTESWNSSLLEEYPDLVQRDTCNAFVACEPKTACIGNSQCAVGYEYSQPLCLARRGYKNASAMATMTRAQVEGTPNACNVTLNPYTFEYEGVDADCRGTLPPGQTCSSDDPENCAKCTVFKDGDASYFGVCECTLPARCSLCTIHSHYRLNNECVPCPENPGLLIGGLFAIAIAVSILGWYLQREKVNLAFITIGIDYFQVLAIFAATKVPWPPALLQLFNIMSVFNFNIDIAAPECITPNLDYEVKWWLQMALPVALFAVLAAIYFGYAFLKMCRWGIYQRHVWESHLSALIAIFMIAMYYLYLVLTKRALEVFNCNPVDPDDGFLYTTFTSLHCDGGGLCRCGEPGGPQVRLVPWSITFLVLYTFGYPAYIAFTLRRNSLLVREDQYLRAYEVGYVRKTNPDCYDMRKRYSKLYYQFKPRYASFWILVLLIRKFWIAFAFILFRGNPAFQLAIVLLVLFTSIVFQVLWRPFLSTADRAGIVRELDAMAERSVKEPAFAEYREIQKRVQECMTLDVEHRRRQKQTKQGAQLFSNAVTEDSGKNMGMTLIKKEAKVSRSVAAARWFTNLNTLEFILLGCGIIICLAGIMFEASARDRRALVRGQVDAITWIVVIVVITSLIYYFAFFLGEAAPSFISAIISMCRKKKDEDKDEYYDPNINLEENPMFAAPKVEFADNRALQAELDQQLAQLKLAEQQNRRLREELKNKKMEAQLDETARQKTTGLEEVRPNIQRKDFAQTRLTAALVGPNRHEREGTRGWKRLSSRRTKATMECRASL